MSFGNHGIKVHTEFITKEIYHRISSAEVWELLASEESGLIVVGGAAYVGVGQRRTLALPPSYAAWEALEAFVQSATNPVFCRIGYEMGAYTDPRYPLPCHFSQEPALFCEEPSAVYYCPKLLPPAVLPLPPFPLLHSSDTFQSYAAKIEAIRESIALGAVYQVNLSQTFTYAVTDAFSLFKAFYRRNPAPYSAYLRGGGVTHLSLSPELFLNYCAGKILTRPIKGTAPRGSSEAEDNALRTALATSVKDQAELLMITDLMRNDLAQVCLKRSVRVPQLWEVEAHPDVFHLVSTIEGESTRSAVHIVRTLFPAGSITGCPKKAAIEHIALQEKRPRGLYTGAIGLFFPNGDCTLNVAIRTATLRASHLEIPLGGAILYASAPEAEYQETLHKGKTFFTVLEGE